MDSTRVSCMIVAVVLLAGGCEKKPAPAKTPLHRAAAWGFPAEVLDLISGGADVNAKDRQCLTALHLAARQDHRIRDDIDAKDYVAVARLLIASGADVNARDNYGRTPLHWAAKRAGCDVLELLVAAGAHINAKTRTGDTPLHYAVAAGYQNPAEVLVANGADVDAKNKDGRTPLHYGAQEGHKEVTESLLAQGARIDARSKDGRTPLYYAAERGHKEIAEWVLAKGAEVNSKDRDRGTALHAAARRGHADVVELLLAGGADVSAKNRKGGTPLEAAARSGYFQVVELLVAAGAEFGGKAKEELAVAAMVAVAEPNVKRLVRDNSAFAFDLYQQLRGSEGNLFFSLYSISTVLAMTYAGARGNTEKQMAQALHFSLDQENLHPAFAGLRGWIRQLQRSGRVKLCTANSLWPQKDYPFLAEYLSLAEKHYGVSITPVDYEGADAREAARRTINRWVEEKTENKIRDTIGPEILDELTRLVLVDAIYFKGNWEHQFSPGRTRNGPFYITPERSVQTPMMKQRQRAGYAELESLQILQLPYVGRSLLMLILLPKEIDGLDDLEDSLSTVNLDSWRSDLKERDVRISLPRFRMICEFRLEKTLQAMGMTDAFVLGTADFSGMDGHPRWLYLWAVLHKAFVNVNEEGTEAAAATGVGIAADQGSSRSEPIIRSCS